LLGWHSAGRPSFDLEPGRAVAAKQLHYEGFERERLWAISLHQSAIKRNQSSQNATQQALFMQDQYFPGITAVLIAGPIKTAQPTQRWFLSCPVPPGIQGSPCLSKYFPSPSHCGISIKAYTARYRAKRKQWRR